ncbi:hypothetical protein H5410_036845 [Solanum commersonii]|uniref:Uncharacterized protein n=1 Tax=Solanum commersonii TaxID=4109 RepID=A0A9J5Y616_SOLCO|nr:hypothetical protein H5410_036845 [Solanum commersonii]
MAGSTLFSHFFSSSSYTIAEVRLAIGQDRINRIGFIETGTRYWIYLLEPNLTGTGFTGNSQRFRPVP